MFLSCKSIRHKLKMLYFRLILSLCLYIIIIHGGFIQDKLFEGLELHIDRVEAECRGKSNMAAQGFYRGIKTISSTMVFIANFTLVVKQNSGNNLMITVTINRCRSKENLDTCEEYHKQPNMDFCKIIERNEYLSGNTTVAFPLKPKIKCPVQKGIYHAYNFTYDLAPFMYFKVEGWYWRITLDINVPDKNILAYCSHMEGYVTNSKTKKNLKSSFKF